MTHPSNATLLDQINIAVIRLDAKVDHILDALKDLKAGHQDHETRLRMLESTPRVSVAEFNALNERAVSVGTMWRVAGLLATAVGVLLTIINFFIR